MPCVERCGVSPGPLLGVRALRRGRKGPRESICAMQVDEPLPRDTSVLIGQGFRRQTERATQLTRACPSRSPL